MTNIQLTLFQIKNRIRSVFFKELKDISSVDFARGFRYCYTLFEVAFTKDPNLKERIEQYNTKIYAKHNEKLLGIVRDLKARNNELSIALYEERGKNLSVKKSDTITHISLAISKDLSKLGGNKEITREELTGIIATRISQQIKVI